MNAHAGPCLARRINAAADTLLCKHSLTLCHLRMQRICNPTEGAGKTEHSDPLQA